MPVKKTHKMAYFILNTQMLTHFDNVSCIYHSLRFNLLKIFLCYTIEFKLLDCK